MFLLQKKKSTQKYLVKHDQLTLSVVFLIVEKILRSVPRWSYCVANERHDQYHGPMTWSISDIPFHNKRMLYKQ